MHPRELQKLYEDIQFDFSAALNLLKTGYRIYRIGWNGKQMWLSFQKGYPDGIAINENTAESTGIDKGTVCKFLPYIMMKTVDPETTFVPWHPSMTDLLSDDWMVVW